MMKALDVRVCGNVWWEGIIGGCGVGNIGGYDRWIYVVRVWWECMIGE